MNTDLAVIMEYIESLKLDEKPNLNETDLIQLHNELKDNGEYGLANFVKGLKDPNELKDFFEFAPKPLDNNCE